MSGMDFEGGGPRTTVERETEGGALRNGGRPVGPPDPEVTEKATRRRFSASYKLSVLEEIERHPDRVGAILRREGLYSSHVANWRKQRRTGTVAALSKKRGQKGKSPAEVELAKLRRENERLQRKLSKAEVIIGAQKKLAEILGVDLPKIAETSDENE